MMPETAPREAVAVEPVQEARTDPEPLPIEPATNILPEGRPERPQAVGCLRTIDCQWCEDKDDSCREGCLLCPECPALVEGRCKGGRRLIV
jgi:hypothetical protein